MKLKLSIFIGVVLCMLLMGVYGVLSRMFDSRDGWRPNDMYSTVGGATYSTVSYSAGSSVSDVPAVSMRGGRSFSRRAAAPAFSYAPASTPAYNLSPIAGTASYGSAGASALYTTSSAEFRAFGGGGNGGGVSMSGGQVKSSGSSVASASGLNVSMPSTSMYAYNSNRNNSAANDVLSSVSGDIAMVSTQAYAGVGNDATAQGIPSRRGVPSIGGGASDASVFMSVLTTICGGSADLTLTDAQLWTKWIVYYATPGTAPVIWDEFLAWYQSVRTLPETPVGDAVLFVLFCALFYAICIYIKRKKISVL